jgi:mercuric ion transport protein
MTPRPRTADKNEDLAMTRRVELITDKDCPNVQAARDQLAHAFADLGQPAEWDEWDRDDPRAPEHVRQYGSPTILVGGEDVAGEGTESDANCCRVYSTDDGVRGVPSVAMITAALRASLTSSR